MGSDGILSVGDGGNLVLSSRNSTVWSTNITTSSNYKQNPPVRAQLLDSGNLVVLTSATQNPAWQSFDYPTHVFLPGMKLGVNRITGFRWFLSSWRSRDDPGQGDYTLGPVAGPKSESTEIFLYKADGPDPIWRTGPWVGDRYSGVTTMNQTYVVKYNVVDTRGEVHTSYTNVEKGSILATFVLDGESGTYNLMTWNTESSHQWNVLYTVPEDNCDKYANCGAFGLCNPLSTDEFECSCFTGYKPKSPSNWYLRDGSDGCVRASNMSLCRNGEGFLKLSNVKVPDTSRVAKTNKSKSLAECREECFNDCSCLGYTSATDAHVPGGPTGCILFHGDLNDTRVFSATRGQDLYFRADALELAKSLDQQFKAHSPKKRIVILLTCIGIVLITFITSLAYRFYRRTRKEWREQEERSVWLGEAGESKSDSTNSPVFRFSTIVAATHNFDPTSFLGRGGFGPVYKGKLSNGQEIAVKRLSNNSGQGIHEFKTEVRLISKLQHKNLVRALGCCVSGDEKMLVYEFLPNKSLDKYIFDEEKKMLLEWSKRHEIIVGIARGVLYLHQDSRLKIIHRDLKASNILLDANMKPKISDFGMARIFGHDQNEENTNRVVGTYGYMSPEYAMEGLFSIKSDVFSFGVIMLEIISGERIHKYYNDHLSTNLSGYAWKLWKDENSMELVDKSILASAYGCEDEIYRCIQIGLLCVQENPNERPTMLEVTFMLSNDSKLSTPREPAFIIKGNNHKKVDQLLFSTGTQSLNEFTETEVDAR